MSEEKRQIPVYKVIVAGDGAVGKTSLIRRFCEGKFEASRVMTIGVDFQTKTVNIQGKVIKLSIWDIAGQDRFGSFRDMFYRGAKSAALVYDVTRLESFENLAIWRDDILKVAPGVPMILVANKIDLPDHKILRERAEPWGKRLGMPFLETSAFDGRNVDRFFGGLGYLALRAEEAARKQG
ncbi:MAG: GTP-binding protein [Anaerolineae bacterium]|nr:GTP-binding protein [Anaerolineae bacterium]